MASALFAAYESYDNGYIMAGESIYNIVFPSRGLIIKTDINGEMQWYKFVSQVNDRTGIYDINQTVDNGMILTGFTGEQTTTNNPFIMKLNPCAEPEWCRIYNLPNPNDEWGASIWPVPGGYTALFQAYGNDPNHQRVWLYRLDLTGELLWKQVYGVSDTAIYGPDCYNLMITPDYHFIISADCYYADPGFVWPKILRPFLIKTDSTGALSWELPWASVNGESFHGECYNTVLDQTGTLYSAARHISYEPGNPGDKPCIIRTGSTGIELSYSELFPNSDMGTAYTINWFADSTMAVGYAYDDTVGVVKCTRAGDILVNKPVLLNQYLFSDALVTHDNKLLVVGGFETPTWQSHAYKFNSNLEYDSVYTHPFTYDSLCPHAIPSDTIPLGCLLVGNEERLPEQAISEMRVFPNPVEGMLHIQLPGELKSVQHTGHFNVTTYRARWNEVALEVYDLWGKRMTTRSIPFSEKEITMETTAWPAGMYVLRLVYGGVTVTTAKVLKR